MRGTTSLLSMEVFSHQVPGGMMSNLISQLEIQKAADRLPDVLAEIPRVRAEVGYPPLVTPMSQIVGTQAVLNVLTGKRWSIVPQEMKDYLRGLYGKAPGPLNQELFKTVLGPNEQPLDPNIRPGDMVKTTYAEVEAEIGDLAHSEEDVLLYALFPNEARTYLEKHRTGVESTVFMTGHEAQVVREEDAVDVGQIRELIKTIEASDVAEVVIEEGDSKITLRKQGAMFAATSAAPAPAASASASAPADSAPAPAAGGRPHSWKSVVAPMVGTYYSAPSPDAPAFISVGDQVGAGDTVCIVEAMKLMNEIVIEEGGIIREIAVSNGDMVEFGTVMFYYEAL